MRIYYFNSTVFYSSSCYYIIINIYYVILLLLLFYCTSTLRVYYCAIIIITLHYTCYDYYYYFLLRRWCCCSFKYILPNIVKQLTTTDGGDIACRWMRACTTAFTTAPHGNIGSAILPRYTNKYPFHSCIRTQTHTKININGFL